MELGKGDKLHVIGPNGIGKTTFLELLTNGKAEAVTTLDGVKIGYYRQDFHNFDFNSTVLDCLQAASYGSHSEEQIRKTAAFFMLKGGMVFQKVATLSEGQKALMSLACLMLERSVFIVPLLFFLFFLLFLDHMTSAGVVICADHSISTHFFDLEFGIPMPSPPSGKGKLYRPRQ